MSSPILVTGAHRSGTTWVGRMLCASGEAFYIDEPFNIGGRGPEWLPGDFPYWFYYIPPDFSGNDKHFREVLSLRYPVFRSLLRVRNIRHIGRLGRDWLESSWARWRGKKPLIKDPIALFSAEWLAARFNMHVIVMIRHPAAFASSLKRLNWQFDFANWLKQDLLMQDLLSPFRDQIQEYVRSKQDIINQAILMWNVMYSVIHRYQQTHPDWKFVKHEQLALNPLERFKKLYQYCGLTWNERARSTIEAYSNAKNVKEVSPSDPGTIRRDSKAAIKTWKQRLSKKEIERIRVGTSEIASLFYDNAEWE